MSTDESRAGDSDTIQDRGGTAAVVRLLAGLALLGGATLSVTLAAMQWAFVGLPSLIGANQFTVGARQATLLATVATAALVTAALAVWSLTRRPLPAARILRWGKLLSPLLVTAFLPALFVRRPWVGHELHYLVVLAIAGLLLERLLALSFGELRAHPSALLRRLAPGPLLARVLDRAPFVLVCLGVAYYAILISYYTIVSHIRMNTSIADLGEYDNQFFNSLKGHPFRLPASEGNLQDWSALKFHADFIIYFLLPFYALKPGPEVLLIIQSVLVALTAIPIYLFGARRLPRWMAAVVALAFLVMPAVQRPNFYDFHAVPIGMFFMAWAIWAVDRIIQSPRPSRRDQVLFWVAFALALSCREDIAFGMVIVSLVVLFQGKAPRLAVIMLAASAGYFVAIKFLIMPRVGVSWYDGVYHDIKAAGFKGYGAVVVTMLTNPVFVLRSMLNEAKLLYLLHMTVPLLFLWLRRPVLLVAALPSVFFTLMVTNRLAMFQSSFQYNYQWFPYIVVASILALQSMRAAPLGQARQAAAVLALVLVSAGAGFQYGVLLGGKSIVGGFGDKILELAPADVARYNDLKAITRLIPPEATVAATEAEGPHVSTRLVLYNLRYTLGDKTEYVLFNRNIGGAVAQQVREALQTGQYGVVDQRGPFVLARRGHDPRGNAALVEELRSRR